MLRLSPRSVPRKVKSFSAELKKKKDNFFMIMKMVISNSVLRRLKVTFLDDRVCGREGSGIFRYRFVEECYMATKCLISARAKICTANG